MKNYRIKGDHDGYNDAMRMAGKSRNPSELYQDEFGNQVFLEADNPGGNASNWLYVTFLDGEPSKQVIDELDNNLRGGYAQDFGSLATFQRKYLYNAMVDDLKFRIAKQSLHKAGYLFFADWGIEPEVLGWLYGTVNERSIDITDFEFMIDADTVGDIEDYDDIEDYAVEVQSRLNISESDLANPNKQVRLTINNIEYKLMNMGSLGYLAGNTLGDFFYLDDFSVGPDLSAQLFWIAEHAVYNS